MKRELKIPFPSVINSGIYNEKHVKESRKSFYSIPVPIICCQYQFQCRKIFQRLRDEYRRLFKNHEPKLMFSLSAGNKLVTR